MRRVLLALLFPVLLAAQQGAFVHSLEHFAVSVAAAGATDPQQSPVDNFCEKCFAHAAVGSAVNTPISALAVAANVTERIASLPAVAQAADVRTPRSRGPPSLL
jgi:fructose-1,6-bisphosphatase/inositol monophosphatase family enzyme